MAVPRYAVPLKGDHYTYTIQQATAIGTAALVPFMTERTAIGDASAMKPSARGIGRDGPLKLDLHMHTHHSRDCTIPTAEVIHICQRRGLDGIAVTDHNSLAGALEAAAIAPPGFTIIPGEEVKSSEGEIIGLFLTAEIPGGLTPEETAGTIRAQGGIVLIPHPFDPLRRSPLKTPALERLVTAGLVDAIEILNARMARRSHNLRGAEFAAQAGLPGTAGSDGHSRPEYAHAWTEIAPFNTAAEFLANLPDATIGGDLSPFFVHLLSTVAKRRKKLRTWRTNRRERASALRVDMRN